MKGDLMRRAAHLTVLVLLLGACQESDSADRVQAGSSSSLPSAAGEEASSGPPPARLIDLAAIDRLKTEFNADSGTPRLLLILSPT